MSYKIEKLTFTSRKPPIRLIDLNSPNSYLTNIFIPNKQQNKFLIKVMMGKAKLANGRFRIDDDELVGSEFVRSKTEIIRTDKWVERLIPPRLILNLSQLFDIKLLRQARMRKNDKKCNYLSFSDSRGDLNDVQLREEIDKTIYSFFDNMVNLEKKLIKTFREKIDKFNEEQTTKIFNNFYVQIKVLVKEYENLKLRYEINKNLLTFFQVLYDQVYSLKELRNSCTCEYNVTKSSNKELRRIKYKFTYRQPNFMVKKRLQIINIRILELRYWIYKDKKMIKQIHKRINLEMHKYYHFNEISKEDQNKIFLKMHKWKKINEDIFESFDIQQKKFFYETLSDEGQLIKKQLIFSTHRYHKKVFAGNIKISNTEEFKLLKKHYKSSIEGIYKQADDWTHEHLKKLNIKFDWYLKNGFKISSLNIIYLKILKAINMKKKNIIFLNVFNLLTKADYKSLIETINSINKVYPELTIINITNDFSAVTDWKSDIYSINDKNELCKIKPTEIVKLNLKSILRDLPSSWNRLLYFPAKDGIKVNATYWPLKNLDINDQKLFINPFEITTDSKKINPNDNPLPLIVKIKPENHFLDPNMKLGISKTGQKIIFYMSNNSDKQLKEKILFIKEETIIKIQERTW